MTLEETLREYWPPQRVLVTCEECGKELYDTAKEGPAISGCSYFSSLIGSLARHHNRRDGHHSIEVYVDTNRTSLVRDIECEITIN